MKRYRVLLASIVIQLCLGGMYAWSTLSTALCERHGLTSAQAGFVFGATIAVFSGAMVWAGRLMESLGPRAVCSMGAGLFGLGYFAASFTAGAFVPLFIAISVVAGAGVGFCYVCPLTVCMRWFPERKGLITGLAVAGFGGGAVVLATAAERLIGQGADVLTIFRGIGLVYGGTILVCALHLSPPPRCTAPGAGLIPPYREILTRTGFWALAAGMFAGTFGGLLVVGNLKALAVSLGSLTETAALSISLFAVGNASGRVLWGSLHDRLGHAAIPLSLATLAVAFMLFLIPLPAVAVLAPALLMGFAFGACFVLYAAELAALHGPASVGRFYPLIFLAYGLAGLAGPAAGGWLCDRFRSAVPAIGTGAAVAVAGALLYVILRESAAKAAGSAQWNAKISPATSTHIHYGGNQ